MSLGNGKRATLQWRSPIPSLCFCASPLQLSMYLRYRTKGLSQPASQPVECVRACSLPLLSHSNPGETHSTHVARWHDLSRPGIISGPGQPCPHTPTQQNSGTAHPLMSAPAHTVIERHGAFHATSRAFLWRALGVGEKEGWVGEILVRIGRRLHA